MNRREFTALSAGAVATASLAPRDTQASTRSEDVFHSLRGRQLRIGMLIFERMDQIDFTGPFCVLSRLPQATIEIIGLDSNPIHDHKGLILTPQTTLASVGAVDVRVVTGGPGQEALMQHSQLLNFIASHVDAGRALFSVCTGALLCGAAGVLRGRRATTHWASLEFLPSFGAEAVNERVVLDGNTLTAAGITAGIDGALRLAALLRGDEAAQRIQLDIQYAPAPPFDSGTPATAPPVVLAAVTATYRPLTESRRTTAQKFAASHAR
jgi:cyclohexyl-isocyanide hydratase